MTIKEAVLKSLEELNDLSNYMAVYNHIVANKYYDFGASKTPASTISASLGDFIRNGDARIKRVNLPGGVYSYYLTKLEDNISIEKLSGTTETEVSKVTKVKGTYEERSLHKLLTSFLNTSGIFSKTIFHETSLGKDTGQTWAHPDLVGIKFLKLKSKVSQNFLKSISKIETFKLHSYEMKREINSDNDLKKAYFQAVSNSSWANYGYLVAFDFSISLMEEMERLNQSFGIGIIQLNSNPYKSKILFPAKYRDLDIKTIDKLCKMNPDFEIFIEQVEKLMVAEEKYYRSSEKEFSEICDSCFNNDSEVESYCKDKNIPFVAELENQVR